MSGEGWSCFAQLPSGLIDPRSASLTLNWLRPKPTIAGFKLTRAEVDVARYERNLRVQRQALFAGGFLSAGIMGALAADRMFLLGIFADEFSSFAAIWAGTSSLLLSLFLYGLAGVAVMRYRRAEPRRGAYESARVEFEQVDAWRRVRCDPAFWRDRLDEAGFELEVAELLAGHLKTGQVMLTRATDDYGVDVLACSPTGRIIVQAKQWKGRKVGAGDVRALAGSRAFFDADLAMLVSLELPSEDEQTKAFTTSQRLAFWNLEGIVAVACGLRENGG